MTNYILFLILSLYSSRKGEISVYFLPKDNADSVQVLIYTSFNKKDLVFYRDKGSYKSSLELQVELFTGKKKDLVWGKSWSFDIYVENPDEARSSFWYSKFFVSDIKKEGTYNVRAYLKDSNGNTYAKFEKTINSPSFLSDPIPIEEKAFESGQKRPISLYISEPQILFYIRSIADSIPVELDVVKIKSIKKVRKILTKGDNTITLDVKNLESGPYTIVLTSPFEKRAIPIVLFTLPLDFTSSEFNQLVLILSFFFTPQELDTLEKFRENRDSLIVYWNRMWKRWDPTPETELNEFQEEIFSRIEYADEKYTSPFRRGALTDRGLCYIVLGPPDEIEQHPFDLEARAYEIWRYYDLNYRFVFMDLKGVGDYEIVDPSRTTFYELLKRVYK